MGTKPMKHTGTLFLAWLLLAGCEGSSSPGNTAVTRPPVASQLVYVVSTAGLSAYQASDGKQCWSVQSSSPSLLSTQQPLALGSGVVYWVADQLYALDASDGTTRWSAPVGDTPGAVSTRGNLVYVLSADLLYAFNTGDGALRWRQQLPYNLGRTATLLLDNGTLYAINGANLTALCPDSGAIHWQFSLDPDLGESIKEIFLAGKTLLVWSSTTLDGLDAGTGMSSGTKRSRQRI